MGKWGVGETQSTGDPIVKGCSSYFGGVDQSDVHDMVRGGGGGGGRHAGCRRCCLHCPPPSPFPQYPSQPDFTWRWPTTAGAEAWEGVGYPENVNASRARCMAPGNTCTWAHDLWTGGAMAALDAHAARVAELGAASAPPLFLYLAYTDPHAGGWAGTAEAGNPVPSDAGEGGDFGKQSGWPVVERDHASVIVNFQDRDVGLITAKVAALGLTASTAIAFASDNGASNEGHHDYMFFGSSGPLRGFKRCLTDGGIRTPLSISWPGTIPAGVVSTFPTAFYDLGDTFLELAGVPRSQWLSQDGRSIADVLRSPTGEPAPGSAPHPLYWCDAP